MSESRPQKRLKTNKIVYKNIQDESKELKEKISILEEDCMYKSTKVIFFKFSNFQVFKILRRELN